MRLIDRRKQKFHFYCLSKETSCITVVENHLKSLIFKLRAKRARFTLNFHAKTEAILFGHFCNENFLVIFNHCVLCHWSTKAYKKKKHNCLRIIKAQLSAFLIIFCSSIHRSMPPNQLLFWIALREKMINEDYHARVLLNKSVIEQQCNCLLHYKSSPSPPF